MGKTAGEKGGGSVALPGKTDRGRLGGKGRRRARWWGGGGLREGTGREGRAVVERDGFPDRRGRLEGKQGQENERAVPEKGIMRHKVSRLGGGGIWERMALLEEREERAGCVSVPHDVP